MSTEIEIQGMTLSVEHDVNTKEIEKVLDIENSYEFLEENIEHPLLEKFNEFDIEFNTALNFYQLSHYEQCELIKDMLQFDDRFESEYIDQLTMTKSECDAIMSEIECDYQNGC